MEPEENELEIEIDGDGSKPTLIYLPGLHGDWTLFTSFREIATREFRVVEVTYPRTLTWSIEDYGRKVAEGIEKLGMRQGWVLAESYSSQVAWAWAKELEERAPGFRMEGIILAGGFVRYPFPWLVRAAGMFFDVAPLWLWKILFWIYGRYSRFRHRHAPANLESVKELVARRTPLDIAAMRHRLRLIAQNDPRAIAGKVPCPVYLLAGFIDPIVPTWPVLKWLRKNCPMFRESRIIWPADHNVLGTEPRQAVEQISQWIRDGT